MTFIDYAILISVLFSATVQGIFAKEYFVKAKHSSPVVYSLCTVVFALIFFVISGLGSLDFSPILKYLPYSLAFAAAYGTATCGSKLALKHGPMALGTLFGACSLLIPTVLGIIVLGDEMPSAVRIAGLVVLLVSLAVANLKKEDARITFLWVVFVLMNIIGNGFCSFTQAAQVKFQKGLYGNEFMITSLALVAIILACIAIFGKGQKTQEQSVGFVTYLRESKLWIFGILAGLANGYTNLMVMQLVARNVPQSVIQPTVSAGGLVLTVAAAVLLYKEKQSKAKIISFALGAVSLVLLNI